jgi:hypothetical protein
MDSKSRVSELEGAQLLPDSALARRLHELAAAMFKVLGGDILDECIAGARMVKDRYLRDLPYVGQEDFRPFVGSREGVRIFAELRQLERAREKRMERAYYVARMRLFVETGVKIEYPADALPVVTPAREGFQPRELPLPESPLPRMQIQPAPEAAQAAATDSPPASRKQIKHAARRLIEARVSREAVEAFRKEGALGQWTVQDVEDRVNELVHGMAVAA